MFGLSVATELFQGSTERTWNCVLHLVHLIWTKLNHIRQTRMPRSRKRHHSRSRSRSRSHTRERSHERDEKHKKNDSRDKDREGKRRKIESYESPTHKRSVSSTPEPQENEPSASLTQNDTKETISSELLAGKAEEICNKGDVKQASNAAEIKSNENDVKSSANQVENVDKDDVDLPTLDTGISSDATTVKENEEIKQKTNIKTKNVNVSETVNEDVRTTKEDAVEIEQSKVVEKMDVSETNNQNNHSESVIDDSDDKMEPTVVKKSNLEITPKKVLSPKQLQKKFESEKKRQQKQREREEKDKKKHEERERIRLEKLKKIEEKQREHEQKQKERQLKEEQKKKEREEKEEQKRKEREEKEQKRKEKEEKDEQKRKEREQEKLKKQQELEEKNKEKQKEEEIKQKTVAAFVNFFVPKKSDNLQEEKKTKVTLSLAFMDFEVKSDMKLPPARRKPLSESEKEVLQNYIENQNETMSYIKDLKSGKQIRSCLKTWPFEETYDDDVTIVEDEGTLGETIYEDKSKLQKFRAKFLKFHENRRPAYFGTWRKKSLFVKPRKPFGTDKEVFNYEEESDDDWEEEEQGESLNGSEDEADKENEDEKDDYEVDNEFFVPHGHLSDDEIDDEETARLSPESLKQKLKLLKDEFDQDMQLKTHKLKPRSIGCIWYNKDGSNVEEAINRYLQPLAIISNGQIKVNKRNLMILPSNSGKKNKPMKELNPEYIPSFLKVVHGNVNRQNVLVEQFITYMANNGFTVDISKTSLIRNLKHLASWRRCSQNGPLKNKFCWLVNEDVITKYNVDLALSNNSE